MPQFNGQNKKRIDPRYFSEELLEEQNIAQLSANLNKMMNALKTGACGSICQKQIAALDMDNLARLKRKGFANHDQIEAIKSVKQGNVKAAQKWLGATGITTDVPAPADAPVDAPTAAPAAPTAAPAAPTAAPAAPAPAAAPRRRRGAVYARGPAVGKIQGLLLKAFGVSQVAESRMLSEATIPSVLGSKNIDQKLGPTTLKSLQKIPALENFVDDPSDVRHPRFIRKILKILQKCDAGGFKDPRCKVTSAAVAGGPESEEEEIDYGVGGAFEW